jgi:hypothetical protein
MGARPEISGKEFVPGPGSYDDQSKNNVPLAFINPVPSQMPGGPNYPGPGQYNPDDKLTVIAPPNYTIGGGTERGGFKPDNELGPGSYNYKGGIIGGPDS